jgi:hypothetical protein
MRSIARWTTLVCVTLGFIVLSGCDKATEPTPVITGSWSGSGGGISINLSLSQSGTSVTGNGSMSSSGGAIALTTTGTFTNPNFSLTLRAQGYEDVNFSGTVSGNSMTGVMNGSGFNQVGMTLSR